MNIEPKRIYGLFEVLSLGLLLNQKGKPYRQIKSVRDIVQRAGIQQTMDSKRNQLVYQIKGEHILKLNKLCRERNK